MPSSRIPPDQIERSLKVIGLPGSATLQDLKTAYRSLALQYHPDRCPEEAIAECHEKMVAINRAYHLLLSNPESWQTEGRSEDAETDYGEWWRAHFGEGPM